MDQMATSARHQALEYDGRIGEIYSIFLLNILFTILTLGIFRFWAITRMRRYFWSRMRFQGERFEYTGTGGQLFVGYILAGLALLGMLIVAGIVAGLLWMISPALVALPILLFYFAVLVLAAGAVFSAQRYRLSRTVWCGIYGGMTGSMIGYGLRAIFYGVLAGLTLMQLLPWVQVRLAERRINASSFGSAAFSFTGQASRLYLAFLATWVASLVLLLIVAGGVLAVINVMVPGLLQGEVPMDDPAVQAAVINHVAWVAILGLFLFSFLSALLGSWYTALFERHVVGRTTLGPLRLSSTMTGGGFFGLIVGNLLIALFTLGLGLPIVRHRNARFLARTLWTEGHLDLAGLRQSVIAPSRFGEGMFQQLDAGAGL